MKIKKLLAVALSVITVSTCTCAVGCGPSAPTQDGKTVNVMMQLAGWGIDYAKDVAKEFEKLYAEEGYKINFLEPKSTFNGSSALTEMRLDYDKSGLDLVFTGGVTLNQALDPEYGECITDLDDLYSQPAINFDGSLGEKSIGEMVSEKAKRRLQKNGKYYTLGMTKGVRGLVYNQRVLTKYGIDAPPVTTDELFEQFDIILNGTNDIPGIRPVTWGGSTAASYALGTLYAGLAQLMGVEAYDEFFELDYLLNEDGTIKSDGYKLYEDNATAFKEVLEVVSQKFDVLYSYTGSKTQSHGDAHAQLVAGRTAFMQDGEYFYNEVQYDFPSYLGDIRMAPNPIISYLGVQEKLDGTGENRELCDDILSFMCKLYDNGATNDEIKTSTEQEFSITLTDEKVARIVEARGVMHADGGGGGIFVMKQSPVKDIAKLFLRMMLSEDAAKSYTKYGMIAAYADVNPSEYKSEFTRDVAKILTKLNYNTTSVIMPGTVRGNTNMFLIPPYSATFVVDINNEIGVPDSVADRDYALIASNVLKKVQDTTKDNWETYFAVGGYRLG